MGYTRNNCHTRHAQHPIYARFRREGGTVSVIRDVRDKPRSKGAKGTRRSPGDKTPRASGRTPKRAGKNRAAAAHARPEITGAPNDPRTVPLEDGPASGRPQSSRAAPSPEDTRTP